MKVVWVFLIACILQVNIAEKLDYPDLSCRDGYESKDHVVIRDGKHRHSRGGTYYLVQAYKECGKIKAKAAKNGEEFCLKKCLLDNLHIINVVASPDNDSKMLELFFNPIEKGFVLTNKLREKCTEVYKEIETKECTEWGPFFECFDEVMNCK